jgi:hypothetical protein
VVEGSSVLECEACHEERETKKRRGARPCECGHLYGDHDAKNLCTMCDCDGFEKAEDDR